MTMSCRYCPDAAERAVVLDRCVALALAGIHREFPHQFPLSLWEPRAFSRARELTPAFYGCYDWHSAVHSHWLLVRALRWVPAAPWRPQVLRALEQSFAAENLAAEAEFLREPARRGFERPYGLAWLLQLCAELREWNDPSAAPWRERFAELEAIAALRITEWLPHLARPIRSGEHSQTAFALGLVLDWCETARAVEVRAHVTAASLRFFENDRDLPINWEPSGHDFLSPSLAEADLLRRVLPAERFARWLQAAIPALASATPGYAPVVASQLWDGKLAHLAGLNFSRTWMLEGVAEALPPDDDRRSRLTDSAVDHWRASRAALDSDEYAVTHWLGSFAIYALTRRGLRAPEVDAAG